LLLLAGWIKILFFSNLTLGKLEKTDKTIIYWVIISFIAYIIQQYNVDAVINRLGFAYNAIGTYFLYRIIIQRKENINTLINTLAVVSAIIAILMVNEQWTGKNMLYLLGGVNEFSEVRYGSVRSQGPFSHSIVAGIFGAMMFPLFFSMWRYKWGNAFFGILGTLSACVLVITCSSSGPIIAGISGFIALLFWPLRNQMRKVQYSIIFIVVVYQVITINPVWALISEFTVIKGSTGFHRYMLVNSLIEHFSEWFLIGTPSTAYWGLGMEDRVNQYYLEAVNGGFLKLTLFILIIIYNFNIIGNKIKSTKDIFIQKKFWALGSALFANLVGFLGISYWDQMLYIWYLFLALITSTYLIYGGKNLMVEQNQNQF
jgi:phosphate starvation-inducible membrane PsiE